MHRYEKRRPRLQDRRLDVMVGGLRQTAVIVVVSDRGYGMVNLVIGLLVVGVAIIADMSNNFTRRDSTLQLPRQWSYRSPAA